MALAAAPATLYSAKEELRACMDDGEALKPLLAARDAWIRGHEAELKGFHDEMQALVARQPEVDRGDEQAVAAFNAEMATLNARVAEINTRGEQFNKDSVELNARLFAVNKRCAGKLYRIKDRDALLKERAQRKP
ncbi:hypothetical protein GJ700_09360 [Duganella sp. FT92W]|uniref:Uncharacterized protein n=1 Tax=Pseudoduganella rivuli TaxID=2666085 RepID=A0A7X2LS56_9BURK|nr:hypothetical protein [Pseudoduganella rivuli]MRV71926.1 hypothetical protein [Pseudoduganella rivuli]